MADRRTSRLAPLRAVLAAALASCAVLASCAAPSATPTPAPDVRTETDWTLTLLSHESADDLSGTKAAVLYDGQKVDTTYAQKPESGNTFLLVEIGVVKNKAGAAAFRWADVRVEDGSGNSWSRMANDTFLENFNFPRVKSTDLTFGTNDGFICFEIPKSAAAGPLYLVHETAAGMTRLALR